MNPPDQQHRPIFNVLMLPWLAHGHITPFFELAKRLTCITTTTTTINIQVHLCSTPINLAPIRHHLTSNSYTSIHLLDLQLPSTPTLPPHLHTTKNLPTHLMPALKTAFDRAEPAFSAILRRLRPDFVIYDFIQPWAPAAASRLGIPAIQFLTTGAASSAAFYHNLRRPDEELPFPGLRGLPKFRKMVANGISDDDRFLQCLDNSSTFIAINSFRAAESKYIDYLSRLTGKEVLPVGPLIPDVDGDGDGFTEWLEAKEAASVVFASFGSEYFMSEDEIEEVARGLELSGVSFIWVVRYTSAGSKTLRLGFMERMGERGKVVEGWAPQRRILAHRSVGGFVTHCGMSSVMEGMRFGVPMVAMPLQLDQPWNARVVAELGVGVEVEKDEGRYKGEKLAERIRDVMVTERRDCVRAKAREMADRLMRSKGNEDEMELLVEKMEVSWPSHSPDRDLENKKDLSSTSEKEDVNCSED